MIFSQLVGQRRGVREIRLKKYKSFLIDLKITFIRITVSSNTSVRLLFNPKKLNRMLFSDSGISPATWQNLVSHFLTF